MFKFFRKKIGSGSDCFVCNRPLGNDNAPVDFECGYCGFTGKGHTSCIYGDKPQGIGFVVGFVQNVCPRCNERFSKPVDGLEEKTVNEIVCWLDIMAEIDRSQMPVAEKIASLEWQMALSNLAEIGKTLDAIGGFDLMQKAFKRVGHVRPGGSHLDRAWDRIGSWQA